MKKFYAELVIVAFFALCLIPSAGILLFGESMAAANEILASAPKLTVDGHLNPDVLSEVSDYFESRFAFRQELSTLWAEVNAKLFRTSVEPKVTLGKEDWLFYAETADDFEGSVLSDNQVQAIAAHLIRLNQECNAKGMKFVFAVAPNKNHLYGAYMPLGSTAGEREDLAALYRLLRDNGVAVADLFTAFEAQDTVDSQDALSMQGMQNVQNASGSQSMQNVLYFHADSHWTSRGAALAADTILSAAGKHSDYFSAEFIPGEEHTGDLYEMLYPAGKVTETDWTYAPGFTFDTLGSGANHGNAITIRTQNPEAEQSLFCWRDSFGSSLYPYLAESFAEATFSRSATYELSALKDESYDIVVLEIVERNLDQLA